MKASTTEAYKTNRPMRERYFYVNSITHAEIHDATEGCDYENENAYKVMLTNGDGVGFWEPREFATVGQARKWCAEYAPELEVI